MWNPISVVLFMWCCRCNLLRGNFMFCPGAFELITFYRKHIYLCLGNSLRQSFLRTLDGQAYCWLSDLSAVPLCVVYLCLFHFRHPAVYHRFLVISSSLTHFVPLFNLYVFMYPNTYGRAKKALYHRFLSISSWCSQSWVHRWKWITPHREFKFNFRWCPRC